MKPYSFQLDRLRHEIKPLRLHWFPRLRSTNDHAAELRRRGELFAPAMLLTGCQLAGRGRGSNSWWSSAGVLTVTFVFPIDAHVAPHQLPLLAGLAIRNVAATLVPGAAVQLKWPNDLLVGGRKLAGLLCERVHKADLVGLGMNINVDPSRAPRQLRPNITSLSQLAGRPLDMTSALVALSRGLHSMLTHRHEHVFGELLRQYDEHHALVGRNVTVSGGPGEVAITGKCEGLDAMGRLLLRNRRTLHRVLAGQVRAL